MALASLRSMRGRETALVSRVRIGMRVENLRPRVRSKFSGAQKRLVQWKIYRIAEHVSRVHGYRVRASLAFPR